MKGLELSYRFYKEHGEPMLLKEFPELMGLIAIGLCGSGSECFGYDDEISQDHDFEPGFCIFIPDEDLLDRRSAFLLERAYSKLPKEFMGFKRSPVSPVGGNRHGVISFSDFFRSKTGDENGVLTFKGWCRVPEQSLLEATNGKIFHDGLGRFSKIREGLAYLPEDVRLKKLAGNLLTMGQSGQYNYKRCIARGETAAAQLTLYEFVKSALHCLFLLNKTYMPYYKWTFRALSSLPLLSELKSPLEHLISSGNTENVEEKVKTVEDICQNIFAELRSQDITRFCGNEAEGHAYSVNNKIKNEELRNLHIMYAI